MSHWSGQATVTVDLFENWEDCGDRAVVVEADKTRKTGKFAEIINNDVILQFVEDGRSQ